MNSRRGEGDGFTIPRAVRRESHNLLDSVLRHVVIYSNPACTRNVDDGPHNALTDSQRTERLWIREIRERVAELHLGLNTALKISARASEKGVDIGMTEETSQRHEPVTCQCHQAQAVRNVGSLSIRPEDPVRIGRIATRGVVHQQPGRIAASPTRNKGETIRSRVATPKQTSINGTIAA